MVQVYRPLGDYSLQILKFVAVETAVDFVLYGVQLALSIAAITILARRHGRSRFTLVAIFALLLSSTISTVVDEIFYIAQFPGNFGTSERAIEGFLEHLNILLSVTRIFSFVLSDIVLIWRAWCLWPDSCIVKSISLLCGCGSIVGAIAGLAWVYWPSLYDIRTVESYSQYLVRFVPLLMTNIVATLLIGTKVLHYRRDVQGSLGLFTQKTQAEAVLLLLLESGIVYILFWVADFTSAFFPSNDGFSGIGIFTSITPHIAGIYPTCVLFAAAGGTTDSLLSAQVSKAMRFAGSPAAHEGARETIMTVDFHLEDENSVGALNNGPQDSHADNIPGPSSIHGGEYRLSSSEGIVEVERETTAM